MKPKNRVALGAIVDRPPLKLPNSARKALKQRGSWRSACHPYISGVAHRISHLEELYSYIAARPDVKMWTGEQIIDWYKENCRQTESEVMARRVS